MTTAMYVLLLVALVLANSPFLSQKWFAVWAVLWTGHASTSPWMTPVLKW